MLDWLRKGASGWVAQLLIALLVVAFGVWGVSGFFTGYHADTIATVGRTDITVQEFARRYDMAIRQLSQQLGQPVTPEQAQMFGVPNQVLGNLVGEATLSDEARTLGLGISNETLTKEIADDPAFKGPDGAFDHNRFQQLLQNAGLTEDRYVETLRATYVRRQVIDGLVGEMIVPDAFMRALSEYRNEERKVSYVILAPAAAGDVAEPTETDLNTYFEAHKSDWRAPEIRAVNIMSLTPADLAGSLEVSDQDAKDVYDKLLASRYTTPELRQVQQIVFDTQPDADAAAAALAGGTTFDELLAKRNLKPEDIDLGLVSKDKLIDPAVADAAFALAPNGVSGVIAGKFGPVIIRVTTVQPAKVTSFEDAMADIKKEIAEKRAADEITDQVNAIEDTRAGGATLQEIATKYELTVKTIPAIDAEGKDVNGDAIADVPGGAALVKALFDTDVGMENNPLPVDRGYVWYEVTSVAAERDRELSEVHDKVAAAWKADEVQKRLGAKADDIKGRLSGGADITQVAADMGLEVKTADAVKRAVDPPAGLTAAAVESVFSGPKGYVAVADGADGAKVILVSTEVTIPPYFSGAPDLADAQGQFSDQFANDLLQQYVVQLQDRLGVTVNQTALQQAIGTVQSGG